MFFAHDIMKKFICNYHQIIMLINIEQGTCTVYNNETILQNTIEEQNYSIYIDSFSKNFVIPEDRENFIEHMSIEYILPCLEHRTLKSTCRYRLRDSYGKLEYFRVKTEYFDDDKTILLMTCVNETEQIMERLDEIKTLRLRNKGIEFIVQNLCEDFLIADIQTGSSLMFIPDTGNMEIKADFVEQINWFADNIVVPEEREEYLKYFDLPTLVQHLRNSGGFCTTDCTVNYKDGRHDFLIATALVLDPTDFQQEYVFAIAQDITALKREQEKNQKLLALSARDSLTSLFNRRAAEQRITDYLAHGAATEPMLLMLLDVDDFKGINDTYGHLVGDAVLKRLGAALRQIFCVEDVLCRWGGDEFIIFIRGLSPEMVQDRLHSLRQRLAEHISGMPPITLSIGGAWSTKNSTLKSLFKAADTALYKIKNQGKDGFFLLESETEDA